MASDIFKLGMAGLICDVLLKICRLNVLTGFRKGDCRIQFLVHGGFDLIQLHPQWPVSGQLRPGAGAGLDPVSSRPPLPLDRDNRDDLKRACPDAVGDALE